MASSSFSDSQFPVCLDSDLQTRLAVVCPSNETIASLKRPVASNQYVSDDPTKSGFQITSNANLITNSKKVNASTPESNQSTSKTKKVKARKSGTKNGQDSQEKTETSGGVVFQEQKKAKVAKVSSSSVLSEGEKQTPLWTDDLFASFLYKGVDNAKTQTQTESESVVSPYFKQKGKTTTTTSSCSSCLPQASESERVVSRHFQQQKRTLAHPCGKRSSSSSCTCSRKKSGLKCYVVEIDGVQKVVSPYFDMPKGAIFIRETKLLRGRKEPPNPNRGANNSSTNGEQDCVNERKRKGKRKMKQRSQLSAEEKELDAYRRVPAPHNFKPPYSCHHLLQESHCFDPWRVLVISIMLNVTTGGQVAKVLPDFFTLCPDAETTTKVEVQEIEKVIRSLGLQRSRSILIKRFSSEYLKSDWTHVTQLHGVGKYAADAYATFCTGKLEGIKPQDHKLNDYWKFVYPDKIANSEDPCVQEVA